MGRVTLKAIAASLIAILAIGVATYPNIIVILLFESDAIKDSNTRVSLARIGLIKYIESS